MPAQLNFKEIAETVDVTAVAQLHGLKLRQNRSPCPACKSDDDRALELLPDTNSFRCHAAEPPPGKKVLAGDCIALYAHLCGYSGMYRAAKELHERLMAPAVTAPATTPQKEKGRDNALKPPRKETAFDPVGFAAKLQYTEEVEALGITETEAESLGVGLYRGRIYSALRYPSGTVAGFQYVDGEGKLVLPSSLLLDVAPNVVRFAKRA